MADDEPSYIDYEAFLAPSFSATSFANALVLATNDATEDAPLDLDTPLSKVLFDIQEIDTHIDTLATRAAAPLLASTLRRDDAAARVLAAVEDQVASLTEAYKALEREVGERHGEAERVRQAAERVARTVRLARGVSRALLLGRQLQVQAGEFGGGAGKKADHRAMVRAASTLASLRALLGASAPGQEGHGLGDVAVVTTLKTDLLAPTERLLVARAQQVVREFSMSSLLSSRISSGQATGAAPTFTQNEEMKARATSALLALYLLTPCQPGSKPAVEKSLVSAALQDYLQAALKSSLAALSRSLAALPTLDRTLLELSARCQNIVALQVLLGAVAIPPHPAHDPDPPSSSASPDESTTAFLEPLLASLDTASLPSFFWRSLASALAPRVSEILARGGAPARALRSARDGVRDAVRACVERGSQMPDAFGRGGKEEAARQRKSWEREATVMVAAVVGPLGR
jgi:hypothetical protein